MGRFASDNGGGGDFQQIPPGTYVARSFRIVDIGTHHSTYQGKPTSRNQFILFWELPTEQMEVDGEQRPSVVTKFYTNSLHEKANLRHDLQSWRGREFSADELKRFDLMQVLGKPCMLTVVATPNGKSKVTAVTGLPRGTNCPPQVNPNSAFWIDEWSDEAFESLSDGLKKLVQDSDEYKQRVNGGPHVLDPARVEDDLPF